MVRFCNDDSNITDKVVFFPLFHRWAKRGAGGDRTRLKAEWGTSLLYELDPYKILKLVRQALLSPFIAEELGSPVDVDEGLRVLSPVLGSGDRTEDKAQSSPDPCWREGYRECLRGWEAIPCSQGQLHQAPNPEASQQILLRETFHRKMCTS